MTEHPTSIDEHAVSIDAIRAARNRIQDRVRVTPMLRKETLDTMVGGGEVHLKCEHLQRTGSFKLRGALNLIAQLAPEERARGVVAASAGNHAQGVAVAAAEFGVEATIFMPADASLAKVEATVNYGADVRLVGDNLYESLAAAHTFAQERGAVFVHPFDDARIVNGQGTLGLEIVDQLPMVGAVVVPVGGGGLASGVATAVRAARPNCRIIGVQASACASLPAALELGEPTMVQIRPSMADGIAVKQPGALTFEIMRSLLDEVVLVEEEEISAAILWSMERAKQVLEGAGAAGLAAVLSGKVRSSEPIAVVLCGGNIDPAALVPVIRHGLTAVGRFLYLGTILPDRPGELSHLLSLLASLRVNILGVEHHREGVELRIGETRVDLILQTRNVEHVEHVMSQLRETGYRLITQTR